jgi:hypothetical protein
LRFVFAGLGIPVGTFAMYAALEYVHDLATTAAMPLHLADLCHAMLAWRTGYPPWLVIAFRNYSRIAVIVEFYDGTARASQRCRPASQNGDSGTIAPIF